MRHIKIEQLSNITEKFNDYEFPKVSVVIPTFNSSSSISITLDSVLTQAYPQLEILIIDAGSTDRTLGIINSYRESRIKIFTVADYQVYASFNKGIKEASGLYICFLVPGDYYLSHEALKYMMAHAIDAQNPSLIFCGTLVRDGKTEAKMMLRPFSLNNLMKGLQPTSLQACWFCRDLFQEIGLFKETFEARGTFELFCRIAKKSFNVFEVKRLLLDYDYRNLTKSMVILHFKETGAIIYQYYGFMAFIQWLLVQKDIKRFFSLWWHTVKVAFSGTTKS